MMEALLIPNQIGKSIVSSFEVTHLGAQEGRERGDKNPPPRT